MQRKSSLLEDKRSKVGGTCKMAKKICNPCHDLTHVDLPKEFEPVSPSLSLFSSKLEEIN